MGDVVAADEVGVARYLTPTPCHGRAEESDLGLKHMFLGSSDSPQPMGDGFFQVNGPVSVLT